MAEVRRGQKGWKPLGPPLEAALQSPPAGWTSSRLNALLGAVCAVVWVRCAIHPIDLGTWAIEQVALVVALMVLFAMRNRVRFSVAARVGMAILFCVHSVGTHFTYSLTPYDATLAKLLGVSLNDLMGWERNHYDRFVHLCYGLCLTPPCQEAFRQLSGASLRAAGFVALNLILASSALYEIVEWLAALVFGGDLGQAYLGTQGDIWDAQFDMALAGAGSLAVLAMAPVYRLLSSDVPGDRSVST